jgi:hypothetical protein
VCAFAKINLPRLIHQVIAIFVVVLWIPGVYVVTSIAPFTTAGNGYLAAWSAESSAMCRAGERRAGARGGFQRLHCVQHCVREGRRGRR